MAGSLELQHQLMHRWLVLPKLQQAAEQRGHQSGKQIGEEKSRLQKGKQYSEGRAEFRKAIRIHEDKQYREGHVLQDCCNMIIPSAAAGKSFTPSIVSLGNEGEYRWTFSEKPGALSHENQTDQQKATAHATWAHDSLMRKSNQY